VEEVELLYRTWLSNLLEWNKVKDKISWSLMKGFYVVLRMALKSPIIFLISSNTNNPVFPVTLDPINFYAKKDPFKKIFEHLSTLNFQLHFTQKVICW
jgi:hypothetical protein